MTLDPHEQSPDATPVIRLSRTVAIPLAELTYRFSRSGGPGGQNVNKVESKVELVFDVAQSPSLGDYHRQMILGRLASHIDAQGILHLVCQESRSQHQNRAAVVARFETLMRSALQPVKVRRATRPTHGSKQRRLEGKSHRSQTKQHRKGPGHED